MIEVKENICHLPQLKLAVINKEVPAEIYLWSMEKLRKVLVSKFILWNFRIRIFNAVKIVVT